MASAGLAAAEKLFLSSTSVSPPPTKRRRHRQGRRNRDLLQNLRSNQKRISNNVTRKLKDPDSKQSEAIKNAMGLTLLERLSKGATEGSQTSPKIVFQGAGKNESKTDIHQKQLLLAKSVGEKKDLTMSRESTSLSFPDTTLLTPKPLSPMFPPNVRSDSGLSSASNSFSGNSNTQKGGQSNDEDAMDTIKRRLEEVQQMTKQSPVPSSISPKPAIGFNVMSRIATSLKKFKKKISPANRARNCLRHSARLALLIKNGFTGRKKYYIEDDFSVDDDSEGQSKFKDVITETLSADMFVRSSIDWETQMCLRTMPHLRSDKQIKRVVCLLRATKAFSHIFPDYVEEELARYLAYEM
ncbi:uncharacterized protein LOC106174533 [Lingula anatina]|uniref:Uncharacterized protein LOC106174533 n=1 Tax=Lingula anatina TaxID=7574 RepID=A0A1S3JMJ3_LINAN|nr:uncharacterized protein LOC106174533 [Lingula anatina]|eukprot:XP_013411587.1 uncharacterized protein LOC106174533 [Lingula anatina]